MSSPSNCSWFTSNHPDIFNLCEKYKLRSCSLCDFSAPCYFLSLRSNMRLSTLFSVIPQSMLFPLQLENKLQTHTKQKVKSISYIQYLDF